ncbi:Peroxisomal NADH pyrophosphatase nudt12 [Podochytrium sp. JEL0797]|nr:Peroxisomal NADH pyrophosphatase nudt12 [Podochytrium sp. JEL0797]
MDFESAVAALPDAPMLASLLTANAQLSTMANARGWTLLHFAARYGHSAAAQTLVSFGAATAARNGDDKTPLSLANDWGHAAVAAVLLAKAPGAQPASSVAPSLSPFSHAENTTYFGHTTIDRASQLRSDKTRLAQLLYSPESRVTLLNAGNPVLVDNALLWLTPAEIDKASQVDSLLSKIIHEDPIHQHNTLVLLGKTSPTTTLFALDVSFNQNLQQLVANKNLQFSPARPNAYKLNPLSQESAFLAQARSILDWHARFKFCSLCGNKTVPKEAGYKRVCSAAECVSHTSVQNSCFPRTDPVAIVCIISKDGERVLLGRQKIWPKGMYSCVAGFMEPGESIEAAARREAREETGIMLGRVQYFASQPWPFPANLMLGMYAEALTEEIDLVDNELEDAKWFTRKQILDSMWNTNASSPTTPNTAQPYAIAHQLLKNWVENRSFQWTVELAEGSARVEYTREDYLKDSEEFEKSKF